MPSFFLNKYEEFFGELKQRLQVDDAILDYNYLRLFQCINLLNRERVRYGFQKESIEPADQLPMNEYTLALEFYLQIDCKIFLRIN